VLQESGPITKKTTKKTSPKHHPGDRLQGLLAGEFFNGVFKKTLMVSHESPFRKQLFP
jgi:hypothetical protein